MEEGAKKNSRHRRCLGRTKSLARCGRTGKWRFFCYDHRRQWVSFLSFFVFTAAAGVASLYSVLSPIFLQPESKGALSGFDAAFYGLKIGDTAEAVSNVQLPRVGLDGIGTHRTLSWRMPNGNVLTSTYEGEKNRIVLLSVDWSYSHDSSETGLANFSFGVTSLDDIRERFNSNGFAYSRNIMSRRKEGITTYNAFEVDGSPSTVFVFETMISNDDKAKIDALPDEEQALSKIGSCFKLTGVTLADEAYLDAQWGKEKVFDANYHPISFKQADAE